MKKKVLWRFRARVVSEKVEKKGKVSVSKTKKNYKNQKSKADIAKLHMSFSSIVLHAPASRKTFSNFPSSALISSHQSNLFGVKRKTLRKSSKKNFCVIIIAVCFTLKHIWWCFDNDGEVTMAGPRSIFDFCAFDSEIKSIALFDHVIFIGNNKRVRA